jgi:F-type H+-transporting ATPase subunit a
VRRARTIAIVVGVLALILFGFLSLRSPKPIIELKAETLFEVGPVPITNTMVTSWIVVVFLVVFSYVATRRMDLFPRGLQNLVEWVLEALYRLVEMSAGSQHARRFFPVIATILLYVVVSNWFGLFPFFTTVGRVEEVSATAKEFHEEALVFRDAGGMKLVMPSAPGWPPGEPTVIEIHVAEDASVAEKEAAIQEATEGEVGEDESVGVLIPFLRSVNTDLNAPLALAIASAIFVEWWGISMHGFFRYGSKFVNVGRLLRGRAIGIIDAFVGILEFVAEAVRLVSFTFRLFGNIFAGEMLFLVVVFLAPLVVLQAVYALEIFVGLIQAFIFAMLTLVFGVIAVSAVHPQEEGQGGSQGH